MISPAKLKAAAYIGVVLFIFFAGFKANGYLWSARYEKLEASHAQAIADQRQELLSREQRLNEQTEQREIELLREIELQRESYALLQSTINETPLIRERIVRVPQEAEECHRSDADSVDWTVFGRLYDNAAAPVTPAEADAASGSDAGSETPTTTG